MPHAPIVPTPPTPPPTTSTTIQTTISENAKKPRALDIRALIHSRFCGPMDACNRNEQWQGLKFPPDCNTPLDFALRFLRHTCRPPSQPPQERQDRETPPLPLLLPHINGNRTPLNSFMGKSTRAWKRLPGMPMDGKKSLSKTMTIKTIEPAESAGTSFIRIRRHPKTTTTTHRHNNHNNNIINHNRQSKSLEEHGIHPPRRGTHTLGTDSRTNSPCVTTPALWWHNETRGTCVGGLVVWPMPYLPWQMSSARPEVIFFL